MELNSKSTYSELKKWFIENAETFPKTLDSDCKFYNDVTFTMNLYFTRIESEMKRLGDNVKSSAVAKADKRNLYQLYKDLQDRSKWNVEAHEVFPLYNE